STDHSGIHSASVFYTAGGPSSNLRDRRFLQSMKSAGSLHLKTYLFILLMVVFGPLGNVLLGKGMKRIGAIHIASLAQGGQVLARILSSATIWAGILSLLSFFLAYMLVLSWADYSYVQPASSVSYAMVALLAHFLLRETISPVRWLGVLIICLGVLVVGYTPPRTTEPR
ncbi:MAG: EamA family transporter, partial [Candidatus Sulfotelmatobacter sp.]